MSELKQRIITALVLVSGAIYWMFYTSESVYNVITVVICLLAVVELFGMLSLASGYLYLISLAVPSLLWVWDEQVVPLSLLLLIPAVFWMIVFLITHRTENSADSFARFAFAQWMTLLLMFFCYALISVHRMEGGVLFLSGAILGVWVADISAYFVGKALGKNKLCPSISPGKSVEGFMGGVVFGTAAAALFWILMMQMSTLIALALALLLIVISVAGDLGESALKRAVGVKDSGKMLPGHGGILDRIDALLPSVPVVVLLWMMLK